jgi:hypothetical protein
VVCLGLWSRDWCGSSCGRFLYRLSFTGSLGLFGLVATGSLVLFNLCLDPFLGFHITNLLLSLASGFFDLLLALQLFLGILRLLCSLLSNFLYVAVSGVVQASKRIVELPYLVAL